MYRVGDIVECKMPLTNLAKVFGPTIVGYSVPDPEPLQMINETKYQAMVRAVPVKIIWKLWNKENLLIFFTLGWGLKALIFFFLSGDWFWRKIILKNK